MKKKNIIFIIGTILLLIGIICLLTKAISPEYLDANGVLQEHFFLLPIGFLFLFIGIIMYIIIGIKKIIKKCKKN